MATLSTVIGLVSITDSYLSTDQDNSSPAYYGFQARDGTWYIMQATTSGATIARRYAQGTSTYSASGVAGTGYSAAWTNRANLTYAIPSTTFA